MQELDERIERAVGSRPVRYVRRPGGYSTADRFAVELADGRSVFVKSAEARPLADWLRREHEVYEALEGSFIPRLVAAVLEAVAEIASSTVRESHAEMWLRWQVVADDPAPFLSLGLRDERWLERALPELLAAAEQAPVEGSDLVHFDVRSDNLCFRDGRAVFVDWNWCSLANSATDIAAWAPSVATEGGPPPWRVLPGHGELAGFMAGIWAAVAGLPPPETAPTVREVQRRQLAVTLDWVDRDLLG